MRNLRQLLDVDEPYWKFNREERNYAALLYYLLLSGDNVSRFLDRIEYPFARTSTSAAYVEYAYLRDVWDRQAPHNRAKRAIITELLATIDVRSLEDASVQDWNTHFGVGTPVASGTYVQSPSRWSITKYDAHIEGNADFLATCRFKWAFNITPDLVIHTDNDHAVVIEAKYASGEGVYPGSPAEKAMFRRRGLHPVGQTELQRYLFTSCLASRPSTSTSRRRQPPRRPTRHASGATSSPHWTAAMFRCSSASGWRPSPRAERSRTGAPLAGITNRDLKLSPTPRVGIYATLASKPG
jgi:hypothetical protein